MKITINLPAAQIALLAEKMGYRAQIEDTSQPLDGDSYPLIANPVTLEMFTEALVNGTLVERMLDRLRREAREDLEGRYDRAIASIVAGSMDTTILTEEAANVREALKSLMFDH